MLECESCVNPGCGDRFWFYLSSAQACPHPPIGGVVLKKLPTDGLVEHVFLLGYDLTPSTGIDGSCLASSKGGARLSAGVTQTPPQRISICIIIIAGAAIGCVTGWPHGRHRVVDKGKCQRKAEKGASRVLSYSGMIFIYVQAETYISLRELRSYTCADGWNGSA